MKCRLCRKEIPNGEHVVNVEFPVKKDGQGNTHAYCMPCFTAVVDEMKPEDAAKWKERLKGL